MSCARSHTYSPHRLRQPFRCRGLRRPCKVLCKSRAVLLNAPLNAILNGTLNRLRLNDCGALRRQEPAALQPGAYAGECNCGVRSSLEGGAPSPPQRVEGDASASPRLCRSCSRGELCAVSCRRSGVWREPRIDANTNNGMTRGCVGNSYLSRLPTFQLPAKMAPLIRCYF